MLLIVEKHIKKITAIGGKVGKQKWKEARSKLVIIVIIFYKLRKQNWTLNWYAIYGNCIN